MTRIFTDVSSSPRIGRSRPSCPTGPSCPIRPARRAPALLALCVLAGLLLTHARADKPPFPGIWGIWGMPKIVDRPPAWYKGHVVAEAWDRIEPEEGRFNWEKLDAKITRVARSGLHVMVIMYHGNRTPQWIYDRGIGRIDNGRKHVYPYYLDPRCKKYVKRLIAKTAEHLQTAYPPEIRRKIVAVQCPVGSSGDPFPYWHKDRKKRFGQGTRFEITREQWIEHTKDLFRCYDDAYKDAEPRIFCLFNTVYDAGQVHDWARANLRKGFWTKTNRIGDRYQNNGETSRNNYYRWLVPQLGTFHDGFAIRARSEMDLTMRPWFKEAPLWNMYWTQLWGLHCFQDMHNQKAGDLDKPEYYSAFAFYSKYAGFKDPRDSIGVWCALRDGLSAEDTNRFPESTYGQWPDSWKADVKPRFLKIARAMAPYGAKQSVPDATRLGTWDGLNDVGYQIEPGNYRLWLYQHDPHGTSQGLWRQGPKGQMYGRFARRFDHASGKDTMYFNIDDAFFFDPKTLAPGPLAGQYEVKVRVVYLDVGTGSWRLQYDAVDNPQQTALVVRKTNTGRWREATVTIQDAHFGNRCPHGTDLMLVNPDTEDDTFHMIELTRETGDRKGCWGQ